ncbi:unnamed protein product [Trichogramma brassicae]|uniref:Uncharacterized protein n=1 Tax=Trichogramma brassicae TaxID=86971 RepID=A0A6H5HX39_9HYME|nr:unnamed protein product [Trichogramma brassicae]
MVQQLLNHQQQQQQQQVQLQQQIQQLIQQQQPQGNLPPQPPIQPNQPNQNRDPIQVLNADRDARGNHRGRNGYSSDESEDGGSAHHKQEKSGKVRPPPPNSQRKGSRCNRCPCEDHCPTLAGPEAADASCMLASSTPYSCTEPPSTPPPPPPPPPLEHSSTKREPTYNRRSQPPTTSPLPAVIGGRPPCPCLTRPHMSLPAYHRWPFPPLADERARLKKTTAVPRREDAKGRRNAWSLGRIFEVRFFLPGVVEPVPEVERVPLKKKTRAMSSASEAVKKTPITVRAGSDIAILRGACRRIKDHTAPGPDGVMFTFRNDKY